MRRNKINVHTDAGVLSVEKWKDTNYPGFTLYLNGEQVGIFEYNCTKKLVSIHLWDKGQYGQDPLFTLDIKSHITEHFEKEAGTL